MTGREYCLLEPVRFCLAPYTDCWCPRDFNVQPLVIRMRVAKADRNVGGISAPFQPRLRFAKVWIESDDKN